MASLWAARPLGLDERRMVLAFRLQLGVGAVPLWALASLQQPRVDLGSGSRLGSGLGDMEKLWGLLRLGAVAAARGLSSRFWLQLFWTRCGHQLRVRAWLRRILLYAGEQIPSSARLRLLSAAPRIAPNFPAFAYRQSLGTSPRSRRARAFCESPQHRSDGARSSTCRCARDERERPQPLGQSRTHRAQRKPKCHLHPAATAGDFGVARGEQKFCDRAGRSSVWRTPGNQPGIHDCQRHCRGGAGTGHGRFGWPRAADS